MYINITCKNTQLVLRTLLHGLPRSSKITVTRNSILYRQSVIIKLAHSPAVLVHLLLKQNALEE